MPQQRSQRVGCISGTGFENRISKSEILRFLFPFHVGTRSEEEKTKFASSWGLFGDIFIDANVYSFDSSASCKSRMLPFFFRSPDFVPSVFYSLETVYEYITRSIDVDDDIVRIKNNVEKNCEKLKSLFFF